jgi:hypothetical protein
MEIVKLWISKNSIRTGKPTVRRRKINSILARMDLDIPHPTYDLILKLALKYGDYK